MDKNFKIAGDLNNNEEIISDNYFKVAGDLDNIDNSFQQTNETLYLCNDKQKYLDNICSGKYYDQENEYGMIISEGNVIISFKQLQEMLDNGDYNIISAVYYNEEMIEIKYQQFEKNISRHI